MKILSNKQYVLFLAQQGRIEQLQKDNIQLRKVNSILNHAISSHDIDFPNSSVRSTDLYDPIDKLF